MRELNENELNNFKMYSEYLRYQNSVFYEGDDVEPIFKYKYDSDAYTRFITLNNLHETARTYDFVSNKIGVIDLTNSSHQSLLKTALVAQGSISRISNFQPDLSESFLILETLAYANFRDNAEKKHEKMIWQSFGLGSDIGGIYARNILWGLVSLATGKVFSYVADQIEISNTCIDESVLKTLHPDTFKGENAKRLAAMPELTMQGRIFAHSKITENLEQAIKLLQEKNEQAISQLKYEYQLALDVNSTRLINLETQARYNQLISQAIYTSVKHNKDNIGELTDEVVQVGSVISNIKDKMATNEQIESLWKELATQGLKLEEMGQDLQNMVQISATTCVALHQIAGYLSEKAKEEQRQWEAQMRVAQYQGLNDACNFVRQIAILTGSEELVNLTVVVQAGIQISRAFDQITAMGSNFIFAQLSPYSAIGMAVITIFSLFQKPSAQNQNKIIMQQLTQISNQIKKLSKEVEIGFKDVHYHLAFLLNETNKGFESLRFILTVPLTRQLSEIQCEMQTLVNITKTGFTDLLLEDLNGAISLTEDLKCLIIPPDSFTYRQYASLLNNLKNYLLNRSAYGLLNGSVYHHLLESKPENTHQLIEILADFEGNRLQSLTSLLIHYAKYTLKCPELKDLDEEQTCHPEIWYLALRAYRDLNVMFGFKYPYDRHNQNLLQFDYRLKIFYKTILFLQTNQNLYNSIFSIIIKHSQNLLQRITQIHNQFDVPNSILFGKLDNIVASFSNQGPKNPTLSYSMPAKLEGEDAPVKETRAYFEGEKNKAALFKLLLAHKIKPASIFLLAESLGLGFIEYEFIPPDPSGLTYHHHTHSKKYHLKPGYRAGMHIHFNYRGQRWPLFIPGTITGDDLYGPELVPIYTHIITQYTKAAPNCDQLATKMTYLVKQHLLEKRKQFVSLLAEIVYKSSSYHELLKLNYFLLAYLTCAGISLSVRQKIANHLLLEDFVMIYESYVKNAQYETAFPVMQKLQTPIATLTQLQNEIVVMINKAKADPHFRKQTFNSPLLKYLEFCLIHLREIKVLNLSYTARLSQWVAKEEVKAVSGANPAAFFNKKNSQQNVKQQAPSLPVTPFKIKAKL